MDLYIKQHVFTWGDRFSVYNAAGEETFTVEGEVFTLGKKLRIYDLSGRELLYIRQELLTFLTKYDIFRGEQQLATVRRELSLFRPHYTVEGTGWEIGGDVFSHEFTILSDGGTVATVSKEWFTFGDAYRISVGDGADPVLVLAVVLAIDASMEKR